jgi:pyruvate/2-oxoglutarate/acetoin dehydrogenase E1 component
LLLAAIRDPNPVMYFEHKRLYRSLKEEVPDGDYIVPLGKANVVREGTDTSIITYGGTLQTAIEIANELSPSHSIEVIDIRSLVPLDEDTILESVRKTSRVLILHEDNLTAGFGAELSALITEKAFEYLDAPIMRLAAADVPVPFAPSLEKQVLPSTEQLRKTLEQLLAF